MWSAWYSKPSLNLNLLDISGCLPWAINSFSFFFSLSNFWRSSLGVMNYVIDSSTSGGPSFTTRSTIPITLSISLYSSSVLLRYLEYHFVDLRYACLSLSFLSSSLARSQYLSYSLLSLRGLKRISLHSCGMFYFSYFERSTV